MDTNDHVVSKPNFNVQAAEAIALEHFGIEGAAIELPGERDQNFSIQSKHEQYVLKIANPQTRRELLDFENAAIGIVETVDSVESPVLQKSLAGFNVVDIQDELGQICFVRCLSYVQGKPLAEFDTHSPDLLQGIGRALAEVDNELVSLNSHPAARRELKWDLKQSLPITNAAIPTLPPARAETLQHFVRLFEPLATRIENLPHSVIHNDANDYNLIIEHSAAHDLVLLGLIDFGDIVYSATVNELAICAAYAMLGKSDPVQALVSLAIGYNQQRSLSEDELSVLFPLAAMRLTQSVSIAAEQKRLKPDNEYLSISETPAWATLDLLKEVDANQVRLTLSDQCSHAHSHTKRASSVNSGDIAKRRSDHLSPSLSLSYQKPLHIVRGKGQYLFDDQDVTYLDCVNNVCHVGHCHPKVVEAASQQMEILNTNTRYLHENVVRYAERLVGTMPAPLEVCFFVNSGSEANDLALRLARTKTGQRDVVVIDHAYHGHTDSLIGISPYKFNGRGGEGKPSHVHVLECPDGYRGRFRYDEPDFGLRYAEAGLTQIQEATDNGRGIAAFFAESLQGCAGQIPMPPGYLQKMFSIVRECGGVCISDEVQVGFGRVGSHFWGFEMGSVVPDIVTLGKPIGNGHPLAAVVTTREIAVAFNNGMEYFNTFGGNPVSAAVGMAVLDVIESENLQQHAHAIGTLLLETLKAECQPFDFVGDIRGSGLFLGIEIVTDRDSRCPAADLATKIVERMKSRRILLSTDGPEHNVIKFKPPMVFSRSDAERLVMTLIEELRKTD